MTALEPWLESADAPTRRALAYQLHDEMQQLLEHPGWLRLAGRLQELVEEGRTELELSTNPRHDDENRGVIRTLRTILELPAKAQAMAASEAQRHRGSE